ncbi:MAG TPA: PEGA domain-containing protein, partial [bacterium]|nr:PEGA domain-containing protein [bacterium]
MSLLQRQWLSRLFILLFLIITPLVLAYATGYHINWRNLKLEKTGLLEIKTIPSGAQVNIEELRAWFSKPKNLNTPFKLKNLRPSNYTVNLSLDGYHSWRKILTIKPAETTFAKDVRLFKQAEPQWQADLPASSTVDTASLLGNNQLNLNNKNLTTDTINDLIPNSSLIDNWLDTRSIHLACPLPD